MLYVSLIFLTLTLYFWQRKLPSSILPGNHLKQSKSNKFHYYRHLNVGNLASFNNLWNNFPNEKKKKSHCTNKQKDTNKPFSDYCAILMSECFIRSGIDISLYNGNRCWSHSGKKHILLAEDFANGLKKQTPPNFSRMEKVVPGSFQSKLKDKSGVIFFKDYWQRGNESFKNRSGDHVDLWNKGRITGGGMLYRFIIEALGIVKDLNKSKEIWFWEVK